MESNMVRTERDAEAFVLGLGLFATAGGGLASRGLRLLRSLRDDGLEVAWVAPEDIDGDTLTCSVFGMGSIAPHPPMTPEEMLAFGVDGVRHPRPWVRALGQLERYLGERMGAVVPFELGPNNTIVAVDVAVRSGRLLVDGDYIGRALPKMSQALPAVLGLRPWPLAICDPWGNSLLLEDCPSPMVAERIGKMVSKVTKAVDMGASCAHAGFAHRMADVRSALVPGTLSRSLELGRAVLSSRDRGRGSRLGCRRGRRGLRAVSGDRHRAPVGRLAGRLHGRADPVGRQWRGRRTSRPRSGSRTSITSCGAGVRWPPPVPTSSRRSTPSPPSRSPTPSSRWDAASPSSDFERPRLPLRSGPRGDGAGALRLHGHRLDAH